MPHVTCHSSLAEHHTNMLPIACYLPRRFLTFTMYLLVNSQRRAAVAYKVCSMNGQCGQSSVCCTITYNDSESSVAACTKQGTLE